jgi:fimbrial chaperone protein
MKIMEKSSMAVNFRSCFSLLLLPLIIIIGLINVSSASAFRVEPMSAEIPSAGPDTKGEIRIENPHDHPITVEMVTEQRDFDANGKETRTPAEDDFLIFPPQTLVQPGKTQLIRYQYIGDPKIPATKAYVINVRQLPIDLKPDAASGMKFLYTFGLARYVVPEGAVAVPTAENIHLGQNGSLEFVLKNTGNGHLPMMRKALRLTSTSSGRTVEAMTKQLPVAMLLPGHTLNVRLTTLPQGWTARDVKEIHVVTPKPKESNQ